MSYDTAIFEYIMDAGHGWLRVLLKDIPDRRKYSSYSYKDMFYAYLEEDCDMPLFLEQFESFHLTHVHLDGRCFIRDLPSLW